jgi:serine/threonine-protein kinase
MADVYLARSHEDGPLVIVKTLRPPATEERLAMFQDEARFALHFKHPNVARVFECAHDGEHHFMAMEYLDGQSLDRLLSRVRATNVSCGSILLWILAEGLAGLHYAHELTNDGEPLHIVHRDFTPQRVFVTYEGAVKTLDFGRSEESDARYAAPEQTAGGLVDRRADVFSAGRLLLDLARDDPDLDAIAMKASSAEPSERYCTAEEMRLALLAVIERVEPLETLRAQTAALVSELFADEKRGAGGH